MADIRVIKYGDNGHKSEHNPAEDSIQFASFKTATKELTEAKLANLIDGGNSDLEHTHDGRYYTEAEHIITSSGAADSGKPVITNSSGQIDASLVDLSGLPQGDHSALSNLDADDHPQYVALDSNFGTRGGTQTLIGDFLIQDPVNPTSVANKQYVDAVATGLRPHGNVRVATTGAGTLATDFEAGDSIDGVLLVAGDRILIKDQVDQTENGIYVVQSSGAPLRSEDQDNSPLAEIVNGVFIPKVLEGTTNAGKPYVITSVGTGTDGVHTIGTDNIVFEEFTSPSQLTAGNGILFSGNAIEVDFVASGGLKFTGTELDIDYVAAAGFLAGNGLVANAGVLDVDFAVDFTMDAADGLAVASTDLASTSAGAGASIIGVQPISGLAGVDNVQDALTSILDIANAHDQTKYASDGAVNAGVIDAGDLVYISANGAVSTYSDITDDTKYVVGMALNATTAGGQDVAVTRFDETLLAVLTGATAGTEYYWDGAALTATPSFLGSDNVYFAGVAVNATDLAVEVRHLYKKI